MEIRTPTSFSSIARTTALTTVSSALSTERVVSVLPYHSGHRSWGNGDKIIPYRLPGWDLYRPATQWKLRSETIRITAVCSCRLAFQIVRDSFCGSCTWWSTTGWEMGNSGYPMDTGHAMRSCIGGSQRRGQIGFRIPRCYLISG